MWKNRDHGKRRVTITGGMKKVLVSLPPTPKYKNTHTHTHMRNFDPLETVVMG